MMAGPSNRSRASPSGSWSASSLALVCVLSLADTYYLHALVCQQAARLGEEARNDIEVTEEGARSQADWGEQADESLDFLRVSERVPTHEGISVCM